MVAGRAGTPRGIPARAHIRNVVEAGDAVLLQSCPVHSYRVPSYQVIDRAFELLNVLPVGLGQKLGLGSR